MRLFATRLLTSSTTSSNSSSLVTHVSRRSANVADLVMSRLDVTAVGKSCLLNRVMDEEFKVEHQVTIGVEFGHFIIKLDEKTVKLQIWDTAGQESFRSVTRIFYKGANVVFLCFDLTREDTFNSLANWLSDIRQHASAEILVYLIGSKADLVD